MSIHRFEDLVAWQRARVQARELYLVTRSDRFARDFGLASQIRPVPPAAPRQALAPTGHPVPGTWHYA